MKFNYFCRTIMLFIAFGLIRQSVEEKALKTEQNSAENGDWARQLESLLKSMLVTECQILAQNSKNDSNDVVEEVKLGCKSLLKGQQLSVDGTKIIDTIRLACQTDGQQMVADLKQLEIETKKITVDGLQGAVAEPQVNEHSKKLLQQFVALANFLGMVENKMSAGLTKDAIHAVLAQKSLPLPSEMMQLVIQLWLKVFNGGEHKTEAVQQKQQQQHQHVQQSHHPPGDHLQIRHEFPVRRRRRRQERILPTSRILRELIAFLTIVVSACATVFILKGTLGMFGDFLRHKMFLILAAIGLYAYLRQHPRFQQWNERN